MTDATNPPDMDLGATSSKGRRAFIEFNFGDLHTEMGKEKVEGNKSHSLTYKLLEVRAAFLCAEGHFYRAIECLEKQHMLQKTEISLLLIAECCAHLENREGEANEAIAELGNMLSNVRDVISSAERLIGDKCYLRAIILLRIAGDMYKCDISLPPASVVKGILKCFGRIAYVVDKVKAIQKKPNNTAYRYSLRYMEELAENLKNVSRADPKKMAEYYASCLGEIGRRYNGDEKIKYYKDGMKYLENLFAERASICTVYGLLQDAVSECENAKVDDKKQNR